MSLAGIYCLDMNKTTPCKARVASNAIKVEWHAAKVLGGIEQIISSDNKSLYQVGNVLFFFVN